VRDLIVEERHRGRTVFFSSHILTDVEMLCDRVSIMRKGAVVVSGSLSELLAEGKRRSEITVAGATENLRRAIEAVASKTREVGETLVMEVEGDAAVRAVIERAFAHGARLQSVMPKRETLEDLFVREAL